VGLRILKVGVLVAVVRCSDGVAAAMLWTHWA